MQHWPLVPTATRTTVGTGVGAGAETVASALLGCIAHLGGPAFAEYTLASLHGAGLVVGSWSVYRVWADRLPCLHLSASAGVADTTRDCFRAYADGLYRADRSFAAVPVGAQGLLRMHADEVPNAEHREAIYRRHRMLEWVSLAARDGDGSVFAVNLYRHENQGPFAEGELVAIAAQAPLLLALVQRHVQLLSPAAGPAASTQRQRLLARCPALIARELDICERLLKGWSHDGIAADLGLSVATVKTYRSRAFARLNPACRINPVALQCPAGAAVAPEGCLQPAQAQALADVMAGPRNSKGALYFGWPWDPGIADAGWRAWTLGKALQGPPNARHVTLTAGALGHEFVTPPDPKLSTMNFDFERDPARMQAFHRVYDTADDVQLQGFRQRNGELLFIHGMADPIFSAFEVMDYQRRLNATHTDAAQFARTFLVPGMTHCRGGPATDNFDGLSTIVRWVEEGQAPERIEASGSTALPGVSRPLCPYPKMARYVGGDEKLSSSFACQP